MAAVAVAGIALGLWVEVPRLRRRWESCREQALIHVQWEVYSERDRRREQARLDRAEAVARKWEALGPGPRDLASIVAASGDPEQAGWFFKNRGRVGLLYSYDPRTAAVDQDEDAPVSPPVAAKFIETTWLVGWRESLRRRAEAVPAHASSRRKFERAAWRPWEPIPADPMSR